MHKRFDAVFGLPKMAIYDLHQDKKGFIYLATELGFFRFDGEQFIEIPLNDSYKRSCTNIIETKDGTMYVQNFSGQFFKHVPNSDSLVLVKSINSGGRFKLATLLPNNEIAFCAGENLGLHNPEKESICYKKTPFSVLNSFPSNYSKKLNEIVIHNVEEKKIFSYSNGKFLVYNFQTSANAIFHVKVNSNNYVIGRNFPYRLENVKNGSFIDLKALAKDVIINHITIIDTNTIAVLTTNGAYLYDFRFNLKNHWFAKESVSGMLIDSQKNYWLSTLTSGLIIVSQPGTQKFFEGKTFTAINLKGNNIIVGSSSNELFELTTNGKSKLIYKDSTIHELRYINYNKHNKKLVFSNQFLKYLDSNNNLSQKILSVNEINQVTQNTNLLSEGSTVSFFPIQYSDTLYKIFSNGSRKIISDRFTLTDNIYRVSTAKLIYGNEVVAATPGGLISLKKDYEKEIKLNGKKLIALSIENLSPDSLLIATANNIYLYTKNKLSDYLSQNLFDDSKFFKVKVFENKIFVVTYTGSFIFNKNKKLLSHTKVSDGFYGCDLIDFVVKDDTMYAANVDGILKMPFLRASINNFKPKIVITKFTINKVKFPQQLSSSLDYKNYLFEIDFSKIDYRGLGTTRVLYQINEGDWIEASQGKILLTSLEPNNYRIKLKAITDRGIESLPELITFKINNPFYKRWYFIFVVFVITAGIVILFYRLQLKNSRLKNRILEEKINHEKALHKSILTAIKSQMNPHFIFNALNTIQSYIYLNEKESASKYLVSFSELTRLILEMSNKEKVNLSEEIKAIELYLELEKMRFEKDFNYIISKTSSVTNNIQIPSMLIQPYIENAVKHGLLHKKGNKILEVKFEVDAKFLVVEIIDNGVGVEVSKKINAQRNKNYASFATHANQKRIELLNETSKDIIGVKIVDITSNDKQVNGTKVMLRIPIN